MLTSNPLSIKKSTLQKIANREDRVIHVGDACQKLWGGFFQPLPPCWENRNTSGEIESEVLVIGRFVFVNGMEAATLGTTPLAKCFGTQYWFALVSVALILY